MRIMTLSRQEINLRRLLTKSELMVKNNNRDERFPKYVASLDDMWKQLHLFDGKPSDETLLAYKKRILNIKLTLGMITEDDLLHEIDAKPARNEREELLDLGVRQRVANKPSDMDEVIDYHQNMQKKIADDMLEMAKNLKEQSQLANKIIRKDTEVVTKSSSMSEANFSKLKAESERLSDHSKRACKWWMWGMLLLVMVVFINMVLFMKVMKKRS